MDKEIIKRMVEARQRSLQEKINNYERYNVKYDIIYDDKGYILEVVSKISDVIILGTNLNTNNDDTTNNSDTTITNSNDTNNTNNNTDNVSNIDLPIPTFCLNDKKYCAKTYGALMLISNKNTNENYRYIYNSNLDLDYLAKELQISKITLKRNIKKLEQLEHNILELVNTKNGLTYKLNYGATNSNGALYKYIVINSLILKSLIHKFNSNGIKLYCLLKYLCDDKTFKALDNKWLCEQIGLSSKCKNNLTVITNIIKELENFGLIETQKETKIFFNNAENKRITKTIKSYRLNH